MILCLKHVFVTKISNETIIETIYSLIIVKLIVLYQYYTHSDGDDGGHDGGDDGDDDNYFKTLDLFRVSFHGVNHR